MTDPRHISAEDLALHAMQALSPEETVAVRSHLDECAQCREELASFNGDLALLAFGADQRPLPAGARDRFMASVAESPWPARPQTDQVVSIAAGRRNSVALWIPWAAVAALILLSLSLAYQVHNLKSALRNEGEESARRIADAAHARRVLEALSAPGAQHVLLTAAKTPPQPSGRAVYLASKGSLIFQGNNLAQLAPEKTYELWVIPSSGAAPIPAGLFRPDTAGNASVLLPPLPTGVDAKAFGVTIEKAGGSTAPTAPIILSGAPSSGE